MARQLVYVSVELFTMIQRQEKKIHPKLVYVATSCAMPNPGIRSKLPVSYVFYGNRSIDTCYFVELVWSEVFDIIDRSFGKGNAFT